MSEIKHNVPFNFCKSKIEMYNQIVHFVELQPNCEEVKVVAYCKVFLGLSTSRAKEMIDDLVTVGKLSRTQDKKLVAIKTLFREP